MLNQKEFLMYQLFYNNHPVLNHLIYLIQTEMYTFMLLRKDEILVKTKYQGYVIVES